MILTSSSFASAEDYGGSSWRRSPSVSIALERVGGGSYSKLASSDHDDQSASLSAFGIGSVNVNPYTAPRLGVDYITPVGVTVGGGLGFGRFALSSKSGNRSTDDGSLFIYTLTPRVGYRIPLGPRFDLTPRAGVTLAGGSADAGDHSNESLGVFAVALSGEVAGAIRLTPSFNLLVGAGFDHTVHANSSREWKTTSSGGSTTTKRSEDIKGSLWTAQGWIGIGGYL
ncbi:hypothetical protein [Pendulispora albinea]|uniref:Outer membrane protein beta-barrel domain-containing protein n=1 Tax=Pendulispora albinea TaxID=2741071 RepID=A0ABZ2M1G6_9BACT